MIWHPRHPRTRAGFACACRHVARHAARGPRHGWPYVYYKCYVYYAPQAPVARPAAVQCKRRPLLLRTADTWSWRTPRCCVEHPEPARAAAAEAAGDDGEVDGLTFSAEGRAGLKIRAAAHGRLVLALALTLALAWVGNYRSSNFL